MTAADDEKPGDEDALSPKAQTRALVLATLETIEEEVAAHGLYPQNDGKLTLSEVLSRAGLGATTLRNKHHHQTRKDVQDRLKMLAAKNVTTKLKARKATSDKISWFEASLKKANAAVMVVRAELTAKDVIIKKLEKQIKAISDSAPNNVVGIGLKNDKVG